MTDTPGITDALAAIQAALPKVGKGNTAQMGTYSYSYADLTEITAALLPLLSEHGLCWVTAPTLNDAGVFVLRYHLMHTSGESINGDYPLPPATSTPQVLGSAITYARRYALCAVTGLSPGGDDDDGAAHTRHQQDRDAETPPSAPPVEKAVSRLALVNSLESLKNFTELAAGYAASGAWSVEDLREFNRAALSARVRLSPDQAPE